MYYNLNRWICIRIDAFGGLFAAALATYLVYFQDQAAATTGFSLNMASEYLASIKVEENANDRVRSRIQRIDPVVGP